MWRASTVAGFLLIASLTLSYFLTNSKRPRRGITLNKLIFWVATIVFFPNLFLPGLLGHLMT